MAMKGSSLCEKNLYRFGDKKFKKAFDEIKSFTLEKLLLI